MPIPTTWRGFWEQEGWGREPMHDVVLRFTSGQVEGEGSDVVGPFTFRGTVGDDGTVVMIKQYVGKHQVVYRGQYDGEGTIHGQWLIAPYWTGPFVLHLDRAAVHEGRLTASDAEPS